MTKPISTPSQTDLEDYTAIKKHLPLVTPKQVKWIKEMFDIARLLGCQEPVAEKYLGLCDALKSDREDREEFTHTITMQMLTGIKSSMGLELKKRREKYKPKTQMNLFHPEAFENL
jgi:hypothetical protein